MAGRRTFRMLSDYWPAVRQTKEREKKKEKKKKKSYLRIQPEPQIEHHT
jgi:hypothetical protein